MINERLHLSGIGLVLAVLVLILGLSHSPCFAQTAAQPPATGMHHMSVTAEPSAPAVTNAAPNTPVQPPAKPAPKALKPEDALKKTDTLAEWPYYTDLLTMNNDTALDKVIHIADLDPGSVPPKALLYMAKALSDRKNFEDAAFYYYAGQLRATFDMARFPPYDPKADAPVADQRTDDQKGGVPKAEKNLVNPHEAISVLALTIGSPIAKWAMADPARLDAVMDRVRDWDLATPYAYLPDYDVSHAAPYDTWPKLLTRTRNDYFTRVRQIALGLTAVRPVTPTPNFSRP